MAGTLPKPAARPASQPCTSSQAQQGGETPGTPAEFLREATLGRAAPGTEPNPIWAWVDPRFLPAPGTALDAEHMVLRASIPPAPGRHPRQKAKEVRNSQCRVIPEGHSHDVASPCPSGRPQNWVLALLALGRPLHLLPGPALAPPGPAPHTHLRRLRAGRTAASQLRSRVHTRGTGQKRALVWSGPNGRNLRRAQAGSRAAPQISRTLAGGGGAGARSPAGEQRGAGMGPRASWVSGDRSAGEGPGRAT